MAPRKVAGRPPCPYSRPMSRRLALLLGFAAGGFLFGNLASRIPSPNDPALFWIGNFSAPWALLPFLTGRAQRSWPWAAAAGVLADIACVAGFYAQFVTADVGRLGLPGGTPQIELVSIGVVRWLAFIAPWVALATATGLAYGVLGQVWRQSRSALALVAVVAPFVAEPLAWRIYRGFLPGPAYIWVVELAVGVAVLGWMVSRRRLPARQSL